MVNKEDFENKEIIQSHSFLFFDGGPPYTVLGWKKYRIFNSFVLLAIQNIKDVYRAEIFVYEYEIIEIEDAFLWGFSFFESDLKNRDELRELLHAYLCMIISLFPEIRDQPLINNHDSNFNSYLNPNFASFYMNLVGQAEIEPNLELPKPPNEKAYKKDDFDYKQFSDEISISNFKEVINEYFSLTPKENLKYRSDEFGFYSSKNRGNKYLREEYLPLIYFIEERNIADIMSIELGVQVKNYDAKITGDDYEEIIEITMGIPENDYLLISLVKQSGMWGLPLKFKAHLKKEIDSLPSKIVQAIDNKHKKYYKDCRILMVVVPTDYTYQNEDYILDEIIKEVRESISMGLGKFKEIVILFGRKLYSLYES